MFSSYSGISKEAKLLIIQATLPSVAYGMFYTDVSYFLTTVQGLSYSFMGIVLTLMGVSTFVSSVPLGIVADRYGRKKMLVLGNVIAGSIIVVFALTTNPAALLAAATFEGVSEAAFSASSGALLMEKSDDAKRNSVFSLYGFAQSLAYGVGSIAIPMVVIFELFGFSVKMSHDLLYLTFAVLCLASTVILVNVTEAKRTKTVYAPETSLASKERHKRSRSILAKYVLSSAVLAVGAGMVVPLMSAWLRLRYGVPDTVSGPILGLVSVGIAVASLTAPFLAGKLGLVRAVVITQGASTVFMFLTPLPASYVVASSVYTVRAVLMNIGSPLSQSLIMGLVDEDERGMASGVNAALWRLPNALSTFVGAYLMSLGLLAAPFFIASALYLVSVMFFWYYFRKTRMPEEQ